MAITPEDVDALLAEPAPAPKAAITADDVDKLLAEPDPSDQPDNVFELKTPWTPAGDNPVSPVPYPATGQQYSAEDLALQHQQAVDARIGAAFKASFDEDLDKHAATRKIADDLKVPVDTVARNFRNFKQTWEASHFDASAWGKANPELRSMLADNPELGVQVVRDVEVSKTVKALRAASDFFEDAQTSVSKLLPDSVLHGDFAGAPTVPGFLNPAEVQRRLQLKPGELEAERTARDAPKSATFYETPAAKWVSQAHPELVPLLKYQEADRQADVSKAYTALLFKRLRGQDTNQLEDSIVDLERQALPADYSQGPVGSFVSELAQGASGVVAGYKGGGVGVAAAGAIGLGVGLATRNPGIGRAVAARAAPLLGKGGLALTTFELEAGSEYKQLLTATTEAGQRLTQDEAAGGAIVKGVVNTAIALGLLNTQLKLLGIGEGAAAGKLSALTTSDPKFRHLLAQAAKSAAAEGHAFGSMGALQTAAAQAVEYFTASLSEGRLQTHPVFDKEAIATSYESGLELGGVMGTVAGALHVTGAVAEQARAKAAGEQVAAIVQLAKTGLAQSAPEPVARMIAETTEKSGKPVTHLYVDGAAMSRMFQEQSVDPDAAMSKLVGPDGPQLLRDAVASGGKVEVPVSDYLTKWGGTEAAKKLAGDTTTERWRRTANQLAENPKGDAAAVQAIADANEKQAKQSDETSRRIDQLEQELVGTGKASPAEAAKKVSVFRRIIETQGKRFGISQDVLFKDFRVATGLGDETRPNASHALSQAAYSPVAESRAETINLDPVTGLRRPAGWEAEHAAGATGSGVVGAITIADTKAINDHSLGGHESANAVLRHAAHPIAAADPSAARDATNFILRGRDAAHLEEIRAQVEATLPEGMRAELGVGGDSIAAKTALDARIDAKRASGELPPRGGTGADLAKLQEIEKALNPEKPKVAPLHPDLVTAAGKLTPEQMFKTYVDEQLPGVLNDKGWHAIERKAHVAMLDMRGLKEINTTLGKEIGNHALRVFAAIARKVGGNAFDFSHLSGDEFSAQHEDRAQLKQFVDDFNAELKGTPFTVEVDGKFYPVEVAFRHGIGETLGAADRALNVDKLAEKARSTDQPRAVGEPRENVGEAGQAAVDRASRDGGLEARRRRARARGTGPQAFVGRAEGLPGSRPERVRTEVADTSFNPVELKPVAHSPEKIAAAVAGIERLKNPDDQARAKAWLEYCQGKGERPPAALQPSDKMQLAFEKAGFVDPTGSPFNEKGQRLDKPLAGKRSRGKSPLDFGQRQALRSRLRGDAPDAHTFNGGRRNQFPTEEESHRAMQDLVVFLDHLREKGAKATDEVISWTDQMKAIKATDAGGGHYAAMMENDRKGGSSFSMDENFSTTAAESRTAAIADMHRNATEQEIKIDQIPPAGDNPARQALEEYLNQVNAHKDRLFQNPAETKLQETVQRALDGKPVTPAEVAELGRLFAAGKDNTGALGYTQVAREGINKVYEILLNPKADLSTFLHESAHVFLELFSDLAHRPDAPMGVRVDFKETLDWMGLKPEDVVRGDDGWSFKKAHHEKWARTFEEYVRQGKEPSAKLAGIFQRFSLWLKDIYRGVVPGSDLNDDIKGVFDRLLATDEEIARTKRAMGLEPQGEHSPSMFRSPAEAGMTAEQWQEYVDAKTKATAHAERQVAIRALKDKLRETEDWWKAADTKEREAAAAVYEKLPGRAAQLILSGQGNENWLGLNVPLDRTAVEELVGPEAGKKFRLGKDGADPEPIADLLGFETARDMLEAVVAMPDRDTYVRETAHLAMMEKYPSIVDDRQQLVDQVQKSMHGEETLDWALKERAALLQKAKSFNVKLAPHLDAPVDVIDKAAKEIVSRQTAGTLNASAALEAERSASEKSAVAALKGDYAESLAQKHQQLLNMFLYRYLDQAREERSKFLKLANESGQQKARGELGLADPSYRDVVDKILSASGLGPERAGEYGLEDMKATADLHGVVLDVDEDVLRALFARPPDPADAQGRVPPAWKKFTVDEMRAVADALKNIQHIAGEANSVELLGKRSTRAELINRLADRTESIRKALPKTAYAADADGAGAAAKSLARAAAAELQTDETWAHKLDGGPDGPWHDLLIHSRHGARDNETRLIKQVLEVIKKKWDEVPRDIRKLRDQVVPELEQLLPLNAKAADKFEAVYTRSSLWSLFLNQGNDGNRQRVRDGNGWSDEQVQKALNLLTPKEAEFLQGVLDGIESLHGELAALHQKRTGLPLGDVGATAITVNGAQYRGGYFPLKYDSRLSETGARQEADVVKDIMAPNTVRPTVSSKHTKDRVQTVKQPVDLRWGVVPAHLSAVIHDMAYGDWVRNVASVFVDKGTNVVGLEHPGFKDTVEKYLGPEVAEKFIPWLRDVANARVDSTAASQSAFVRKVGPWARSRMALATMGLNFPSLSRHMLDPFSAMADSEAVAPWHITGAYLKVGNPMNWTAEALPELHLSKQIAHIEAQHTANLVAELGKIGPSKGKMTQAITAAAFAAHGWVHHFTSRVLFKAAYDQAIAKGATVEDAVKRGDDVIYRHLPTGDIAEKPPILRSKSGLASLVMFYGYANKMHNLRARSFDDAWRMWNGSAAQPANKTRAVGELAGKWLALGATSALGTYLAGRAWKKEEDPAAWVGEEVLLSPLDDVPLVGAMTKKTASGVIESVHAGLKGEESKGGHKVNIASAPELALVGQLLDHVGQGIHKAWNSDAETSDKAWATAETLLSALGPANAVQRMMQYPRQVASGEETPANVFEAGGKFFYGNRKDQSVNPLTSLGDLIEGR